MATIAQTERQKWKEKENNNKNEQVKGSSKRLLRKSHYTFICHFVVHLSDTTCDRSEKKSARMGAKTT